MRQFVASLHHGGLGSNPGHFMWDLWWTVFLRQVSVQVLLFPPVSIISPVHCSESSTTISGTQP